MCDGRDTPWLQDTDAAGWWSSWNPTYRDVIILDGDGDLADVYNLTDNPISTNEGNYIALKQAILDVAQGN
jgi:hypothetical protein